MALKLRVMSFPVFFIKPSNHLAWPIVLELCTWATTEFEVSVQIGLNNFHEIQARHTRIDQSLKYFAWEITFQPYPMRLTKLDTLISLCLLMKRVSYSDSSSFVKSVFYYCKSARFFVRVKNCTSRDERMEKLNSHNEKVILNWNWSVLTRSNLSCSASA